MVWFSCGLLSSQELDFWVLVGLFPTQAILSFRDFSPDRGTRPNIKLVRVLGHQMKYYHKWDKHEHLTNAKYVFTIKTCPNAAKIEATLERKAMCQNYPALPGKYPHQTKISSFYNPLQFWIIQLLNTTPVFESFMQIIFSPIAIDNTVENISVMHQKVKFAITIPWLKLHGSQITFIYIIELKQSIVYICSLCYKF